MPPQKRVTRREGKLAAGEAPKPKLTKEEQEAFIQAIRDGYHGNMIFDNLPSAAAIDDEETRTQPTIDAPGRRLPKSTQSRPNTL